MSFETPGCLTIGSEVFKFAEIHLLRSEILKLSTGWIRPVKVAIRGKSIPFAELCDFVRALDDILRYCEGKE